MAKTQAAEKQQDLTEVPAEAMAAAESDTETCDNHPDRPSVFTQDEPHASKASWCAECLPGNLRADAIESNRALAVTAYELEERRSALSDQTVEDLSKEAQRYDVPGRSNMNKDELVEAVLRAEIQQHYGA